MGDGWITDSLDSFKRAVHSWMKHRCLPFEMRSDSAEEEESFICHIHNYTEYNQQWNVFSAFTQVNPSAHTLGAVGSWRCCARGAVGGSVPCLRVSPQSWTIPAGAEIRNPQPWVTSPTLYPLQLRLPLLQIKLLLYNTRGGDDFWCGPPRLNECSGNTAGRKEMVVVWSPVMMSLWWLLEIQLFLC